MNGLSLQKLRRLLALRDEQTMSSISISCGNEGQQVDNLT